MRLVAAGAVLATATAGADGGYAVQVSNALADGTYAVQAQAIDAAGNTSGLSAAFGLTIDATAPATPSAPALLAADDSGTVGDGITDVRQPHLSGTAPAGTTVRLVAAGAVLATATAGANGSYTAQVSSPLADGAYAVEAQAVDAAGNVSPLGAAFSLTIDATPPATPSAPALLAADDSGTVGDGITSVRQPHLSGTAPAGTTVRLVAAGAVLATATAGANGSYTAQVSSPLADGAYAVEAQAVDAAGNLSAPPPRWR